jgi:hypothetical protein
VRAKIARILAYGEHSHTGYFRGYDGLAATAAGARGAAGRTLDNLWDAITGLVDLTIHAESASLFTEATYETE